MRIVALVCADCGLAWLFARTRRGTDYVAVSDPEPRLGVEHSFFSAAQARVRASLRAA